MSKSTKTHHYTYIIRHVNGRYYVGRRSTKKDPLLDPYMGSGKWVKGVKDRSTLTKTIIAYYDSSDELKIAEMELIDKYFLDEYCMNISYSSNGAASGDKHHNYGKFSGVNNPMYGKLGELSPHYGKRGELSHMYGTTHTEERKQKISDALSGEKCYKASITNHIVKLILIRIAEGLENKPIADEYNTSMQIISKIRHKRTWKHVTI